MDLLRVFHVTSLHSTQNLHSFMSTSFAAPTCRIITLESPATFASGSSGTSRPVATIAAPRCSITIRGRRRVGGPASGWPPADENAPLWHGHARAPLFGSVHHRARQMRADLTVRVDPPRRRTRALGGWGWTRILAVGEAAAGSER